QEGWPALTDTSYSLARPGAVAAEGVDAGVASHFGNPFTEQRTLAAGDAVVQVPRGIVAVSGDDRLSWLHSLTSQQLLSLTPGDSAESLLMGQTGRIEHVLRVIDDGHTTWLLVEPGEAADVAAWLESMRFMMRVGVADRSSDFAVFGLFGDSS